MNANLLIILVLEKSLDTLCRRFEGCQPERQRQQENKRMRWRTLPHLETSFLLDYVLLFSIFNYPLKINSITENSKSIGLPTTNAP